jgi:hypothetical protein
MTQEATIITIKKACAEFLSARAEGLTRRALRNHQEVLDLWVEFLDDRGIGSIDLGPPAANARRTASLEQINGLLDDFNDDYLVAVIKAERDFLRTAGAVTRDFSRWLKALTTRQGRQSDEATASAGRAHA